MSSLLLDHVRTRQELSNEYLGRYRREWTAQILRSQTGFTVMIKVYQVRNNVWEALTEYLEDVDIDDTGYSLAAAVVRKLGKNVLTISREGNPSKRRRLNDDQARLDICMMTAL